MIIKYQHFKVNKQINIQHGPKQGGRKLQRQLGRKLARKIGVANELKINIYFASKNIQKEPIGQKKKSITEVVPNFRFIIQKARQNLLNECRFCNCEMKKPNRADCRPAFRKVCNDIECQKLIKASCDKVLKCGHLCRGVRYEKECLPCIEPECIAKEVTQDKDELCAICYTSGLGQEPCVQLDCKHMYHLSCVKKLVNSGWNGARIVFNHLDCPMCKRGISCSSSQELTKFIDHKLKYKKIVEQKAIKRAEYDKIQNDEKFKRAGNPYGQNLLAYAMDVLSYYQCYECKDPYFVGRKECAAGADFDENSLNKEEMLCARCMPMVVGGGLQNCEKHGADYIDWKCKYCCSPAVWWCGDYYGHMCEPCHNMPDTVAKRPVAALPQCPGSCCQIKMEHPAPGVEFALGCGLCAEEAFKKILDF